MFALFSWLCVWVPHNQQRWNEEQCYLCLSGFMGWWQVLLWDLPWPILLLWSAEKIKQRSTRRLFLVRISHLRFRIRFHFVLYSPMMLVSFLDHWMFTWVTVTNTLDTIQLELKLCCVLCFHIFLKKNVQKYRSPSTYKRWRCDDNCYHCDHIMFDSLLRSVPHLLGLSLLCSL